MVSSQGKAGQAARAAALKSKKVGSPASTTNKVAPVTNNNWSASRQAIQDRAMGITQKKPINKPDSQFRGDLGKSIGIQQKEGLLTNVGTSEFDKTKIQPGDISKYKFGKEAYGLGNQYLDTRDEQVAKNIIAQGGDVGEYLKGQQGFSTATPEEQQRTIDAITKRIGAFEQPTKEDVVPEIKRDLVGEIQTKEQIDTTLKAQQDMQYLKDQNAKQLEIDRLNAANAGISRSEVMDKSLQQLDALKQSVAYLGTRGQPGVSSVQLDAIRTQVDSAQTTYNRLVQVKQNEAQAQAIGMEYNAQAFEKQISDLQYQLDQQVSTAVQSTINKLTAEGESIDTLDELNQVKGTMMQELDKSIANIAISNQSQRKLILDRYNEVIATSEEIAKNSNIVNEAMSNSTGFIVDGNGENKFDANGQKIPYISDAMKPIYDTKDNVLIQFTRGPNGEIVANTTKAFGRGGAGGGGGEGIRGVSGVTTAAGAPQFSSNYNPNMIAAYTAYIEKGQVPTQSQIKSLGGLSNFASDAYQAYIANENKSLSAGGFELIDPSLYATLNADQRKTLDKDMRTLRGVVQKIDSINKKISDNGLPALGQTMFGYGRELKQQVKDLQLILKEEGIYNLGVLNGPDLTIIEGALPNIDTKRRAEGAQQYMAYMNNMKDIFINNVNSNISGQGLKFKSTPNITTVKSKTNIKSGVRADIFN